jgi:hypothetical protein
MAMVKEREKIRIITRDQPRKPLALKFGCDMKAGHLLNTKKAFFKASIPGMDALAMVERTLVRHRQK